MSKGVLKDTKGVLNFNPRGLEPLFRSGSTAFDMRTNQLTVKYVCYIRLRFFLPGKYII